MGRRSSTDRRSRTRSASCGAGRPAPASLSRSPPTGAGGISDHCSFRRLFKARDTRAPSLACTPIIRVTGKGGATSCSRIPARDTRPPPPFVREKRSMIPSRLSWRVGKGRKVMMTRGSISPFVRRIGNQRRPFFALPSRRQEIVAFSSCVNQMGMSLTF